MILRIPDKLSDEQIEKFKRIYKEVFNLDFSNEEAEKEGLCLIRLIALVIDKREN